MELKTFIDSMNSSPKMKHRGFKFFKAEYPKGHDDDPLVIGINLNRGNVVVYFKFDNDMIYAIHVDCSFYELCDITDEINRLLKGE